MPKPNTFSTRLTDGSDQQPKYYTYRVSPSSLLLLSNFFFTIWMKCTDRIALWLTFTKWFVLSQPCSLANMNMPRKKEDWLIEVMSKTDNNSSNHITTNLTRHPPRMCVHTCVHIIPHTPTKLLPLKLIRWLQLFWKSSYFLRYQFHISHCLIKVAIP